MQQESAYYSGASESEVIFFAVMILIAFIAVLKLRSNQKKNSVGNIGNKHNVDMFIGGKTVTLDEDEKSQYSVNEYAYEEPEITKKPTNPKRKTAKEQVEYIKKARKEKEILDSILESK